MPRVNIVKRIKIEGRWVLRSIPRKESGAFDWGALPDGRYFVEWYEDGKRRRELAGTTSAQAPEARRKKRHALEGRRLGLIPDVIAEEPPEKRPLQTLIDQLITTWTKSKRSKRKTRTENTKPCFSAWPNSGTKGVAA